MDSNVSEPIEIDGYDVDDHIAAIRERIERWSEADLSGDGGDWVWVREPYDDCYTLLDIVDELTGKLQALREENGASQANPLPDGGK